MDIKYVIVENLSQIENSTQFLIKTDKKLNKISHDEILEYLFQDGINVEAILILKYYDEDKKSYLNIPENEEIKINQELKLIMIMQTPNEYNTPNLNENDNYNFLEMKILELEEKVIEIIEKVDSSNNISNLMREEIFSSDRLEIAFLYSNPLIKIHKNKIIAMHDPVGFESEIKTIVDTFKASNKKISAIFEVATIETFLKSIRMNPKILHISCHGSYEDIHQDSFYLHFEDDSGRLLKFDLENLKDLLNNSSQEEMHQIEVVFISACHSEAISEVFRQANVPVVVCVHSSTQILDEAARKFSKIFYNSLLDGKSILYSFEQAKGVVSVAIDKFYSGNFFHCCCSHNHKKDCKWFQKAIKDNEESHQMHLKNCTCNYKESHIHNKRCTWANKFMKKFDINLNDINDQNFIKVCCCSPEIAHDESNKFILKMDPDYKNKSLFNNLTNGNLEIKNKNCFLNLNLSVDLKTSLIGRNKELYEIFEYLSNGNSNRNRLVTIYGDQGMGKNSLAKLSARHLFERNIFPDGVVYINTLGNIVNDIWILNKILSSLELDIYSVNDIKQFCKIVGNLKFLIIIQFSDKNTENILDFKRLINSLLENSHNLKFIVTSCTALEIQRFEKKILLQPLDLLNAAKLLNVLAGSFLPENLKNNLGILMEDEIIKISLGVPNKIFKIAGLLQEHKKYKVVIERIRKENLKMENLSNELIKVIIQNLNLNSDDNLIYEILYLMIILPNGILENEIIEIFKDNYQAVLNVIEHMSNSTIIISKNYLKELKTNCYQISPDLIISIESLNIKDEIKIKIYKQILIYYSKLCRHILNNISVDNTSQLEFSACINDGIWYSLKRENSSKFYKEESIYNPIKRFDQNEINIMSLIKIENKNLKSLFNNNDEDFIEAIQNLTICVVTILKLNKRIKDCLNYFDHFSNFCKFYPNYLNYANGRLLLFSVGIQLTLIQNDKEIFIKINNIISQAEYLFKNYEDGLAQCNFARAVVETETLILNLNNNSLDKFENEIKSYFNNSITIFSNISDETSLARVIYILAEYQLKLNIFNNETLENFLKSLDIFTRNNLFIFKTKTLLGISKFYLQNKNYKMSQKYAVDTKDLLQKIKLSQSKNSFIRETNEKINLIIEKSVGGNSNICSFLFSNNLIKNNSNSIFNYNTKSQNNIINFNSNFKQNIKEKISETKKKIIFKFDCLTEENFKNYLNNLGKVFCLFTNEYNNKGSLFTENLIGESNELSLNYIQNILNDNLTSKINYEILILAFPQNKILATNFTPFIKNIIYFEFNEDFLKMAKMIPNENFNSLIENFVIVFLHNLISDNLENSFNYAKIEFSKNLIKFDEIVKSFNLLENDNRKFLGDVYLINNNSFPQNIFIFNQDELEEGEILDLSTKTEKIKNFKKGSMGFVGRKNELHEVINLIIENEYVDIYGNSGVGKSFFTQEVCFYLHSRNFFSGGIFYFDLYNIHEWHNLKDLFIEFELYSVLEELKKNFIKNNFASKFDTQNKILVFLDNVDNLLLTSENNLFVQLSSFNSDKKNVHFILTSNNKIYSKNNEKIEFVNLNPLDNLESGYLFLFYVKRQIYPKEIDFDHNDNYFDEDNNYSRASVAYNNIPIIKDSKNLNELIQFSNRFKMCKGYPKYLKLLAEKVSVQTLNSIDLNDFLPKTFIKISDKNLSRINSNNIKDENRNLSQNESKFKMNHNQFNHNLIKRNNTKFQQKQSPKTVLNRVFNNERINQNNIKINSGNSISLKNKFDLRSTRNYLNLSSVKEEENLSNSKSISKSLNIINKFNLNNFENPELNNFNEKIDINQIPINLNNTKNYIKVPNYKYDNNIKKWVIYNNFKNTDLIANNGLTIISKNIIQTFDKDISLENFIVAYTPDFITLQNVNFSFLDLIANLKFIKDTYYIILYPFGELYTVIFSKYLNNFYTFNENKKNILFSFYDLVTKEEGVDKFLISTLDNNSNLLNFNDLFSKFRISIICGEFSSKIKDYKDIWEIYKANNNLKDEEGITNFKNNTRDDKILFKDINGKTLELEFMEIIGKQEYNSIHLDRATLLATFSIKN